LGFPAIIKRRNTEVFQINIKINKFSSTARFISDGYSFVYALKVWKKFGFFKRCGEIKNYLLMVL
jgi:hypothetical protein